MPSNITPEMEAALDNWWKTSNPRDYNAAFYAGYSAALSAQPVDTRREAFDAGWNMHAALQPAPASSEPVEYVEKVSTEAAMSQWERSLKRPDLSEKDRVRGAIEAYKRQAFAFSVIPPAPTGDGWRPIETAPKDGTPFIGWDGKRAFRCFSSRHYVKWPHEEGGPTYRDVWSGDYYDSILPEKPTHWQPLPPAPTPEGGR